MKKAPRHCSHCDNDLSVLVIENPARGPQHHGEVICFPCADRLAGRRPDEERLDVWLAKRECERAMQASNKALSAMMKRAPARGDLVCGIGVKSNERVTGLLLVTQPFSGLAPMRTQGGVMVVVYLGSCRVLEKAADR